MNGSGALYARGGAADTDLFRGGGGGGGRVWMSRCPEAAARAASAKPAAAKLRVDASGGAAVRRGGGGGSLAADSCEDGGAGSVWYEQCEGRPSVLWFDNGADFDAFASADSSIAGWPPNGALRGGRGVWGGGDSWAQNSS